MNLAHLRDSRLNRNPHAPHTGWTSSYVGPNRKLRFLRDGELQISKVKGSWFSAFDKNAIMEWFLLFLPLFDELVQSRTESFWQTVFFHRSHMGRSFRNILKNSRYRPFSALFSTHEHAPVGQSQMMLHILVDNPKPKAKQGASSIYFSRLLAMMSYETYSKGSMIAQKDNELEPIARDVMRVSALPGLPV